MQGQMAALVRFGVHAQALLPDLLALREYCVDEPDFPEHCRQQKVVAIDGAIAAIRAAKEVPELRWLGKPPGGAVPSSSGAGRKEVGR
jgi:hypothetical protein